MIALAPESLPDGAHVGGKGIGPAAGARPAERHDLGRDLSLLRLLLLSALLDTQPFDMAGAPMVSIRVSLRWVPEPAFEDTDTLIIMG